MPDRPAPIKPVKRLENEFRRAVVATVTSPTERAYRLAVAGAPDAEIKAAMRSLPRLTREQVAGLDRAVIAQGNKISKSANRRWRLAMRGSLPESAIRRGARASEVGRRRWTTRATRYLRGVRTDQRARLRALADKGLEGDELKRELRKELGIQRRRVRTVTRDQTQKRFGDESMERQTAAGINSYVWISQRDERVRPDHERLDGRIRMWDDRPRPGEPVNCRCFAQANIRKRSAA